MDIWLLNSLIGNLSFLFFFPIPVSGDLMCSVHVSLSFCKVCERSLSGSGAGPNAASAAQFVRAEMLPSGYLIRPCEGGGSIIHIVDHLNLEV